MSDKGTHEHCGYDFPSLAACPYCRLYKRGKDLRKINKYAKDMETDLANCGNSSHKANARVDALKRKVTKLQRENRALQRQKGWLGRLVDNLDKKLLRLGK